MTAFNIIPFAPFSGRHCRSSGPELSSVVSNQSLAVGWSALGHNVTLLFVLTTLNERSLAEMCGMASRR